MLKYKTKFRKTECISGIGIILCDNEKFTVAFCNSFNLNHAPRLRKKPLTPAVILVRLQKITQNGVNQANGPLEWLEAGMAGGIWGCSHSVGFPAAGGRVP